ncbi:MAG: aldo/keto reductase [Chloroflexi bacterium AL-W]|nr:aldo/keto reductase [Chloroflexi bacterium AL-N1]NOK68267.1 aldo/keto reductase [Chloroflexi bacterium AL-N10]NOK73913.1 aldo/keto reductase [Chloroflexi bacterium AL-N5]NOK82881.1 aldo/keto reductase [Chloroflexi bacterium AL-W]NOK90403.1 aldo/keto reductase [Chloroflexi bacterium AL-N15]
MEKRVLGSSGIKVGAMGLGCMGMSWAYGSVDADQAMAVIHRAIDLGVTLLDTSDVYGPFTNEELVGQALRSRRDEVVVATKCGLVVEDIATYRLGRNGTPEHIKTSCEASLKRLGIETIDLYYLHRVDPDVPIEESVGALAELVQEGKVRAIGLSEVDIETLERAQRVHPIAALQSELSLWTRDVLPEILPWCATHNVAMVPFSPLGRGFLTGRYASSEQFGDGDFRSRNPRFQQEALDANRQIVEQIEGIASRYGITSGQIALAWVLALGEQVIPIPGTKRMAYLEENVAASMIQLTNDDMALLNELPVAVGSRY